MSDDDYIYDEDSGEWVPAAELAAKHQLTGQVEVRDAVGNLLADGDQVTLVKDLDVKGAGQTLKRGTLIKSIRLTGIRRRSTAATRASKASCCAPSSSASGDDTPEASHAGRRGDPGAGRRGRATGGARVAWRLS